MQDDYTNAAIRNARIYRELKKILSLFKAGTIPVILLKGAYLTESLYEDIGQRKMIDVDLLVKKEDLKRLDEILLDQKAIPEQFNRLLTHESAHFGYQLFPSRLRLELHWELLPLDSNSKIKVADVWDGARIFEFWNTGAKVLSPEYLLIYQCLHAAKHIDHFKLILLYDIFLILKKYEKILDWEKINLIVNQWQVVKPAYIFLKLTEDLLGAELTEEGFFEFNHIISEKEYINFKSLFTNDLLKEKIYNEQKPGSKMWRLWEEEGMKNKINIIVKHFFPARQQMALDYPAAPDSWKILFYYAARMKEQLFKHYKNFGKMAFRNQETINEAKVNNEIENLKKWLFS